MAGIESFQQSGLKISPQRSENADHQRKGVLVGFRRVKGWWLRTGDLKKAMTKDIEPLRSSLRRTAVAGEYASEVGIETRE